MSLFSATEDQLNAFSSKNAGFSHTEALLFRLIRMVDKQMTDKANHQLRQYGLSLTEYNVLTMLDASGEGMSVSELVARTGEKPSNITRLTDQLVSKALLERHVSTLDRRVWIIKLSAQGKSLLARLLPDISAQLTRIFSALEPAQCQALESSLKTVLQNVVKEPS